jgi:hypothetical protein
VAIKPGVGTADPKEAVLSELVFHHLHREETGIFKAAERGMTSDAPNELGDAMACRFQEVLEGGLQGQAPEGAGPGSAAGGIVWRAVRTTERASSRFECAVWPRNAGLGNV